MMVVLTNQVCQVYVAYLSENCAQQAQLRGEDLWGQLHRRFDLTRLVPSLLAAAAASKPWSERALRDVTMFTAESAC
ncbi:hypothetical protein IXO92_14405 [Xanthomonas oryzae pv. oryzae]|nr:hypothetical protein IXO92_14405 [Xanthomonas oryzae pv. oryzae]